MNKIRAAAIIYSSASPFQIQASYFHTTHVLERRNGGRSGWKCSSKRSNYYNRRERRNSKRMLRNMSSFAEQLLQSWQSNHYTDGFKGGKSRNKEKKAWSRHYQFSVDDDDEDDDFEVENIFRYAFGQKGYSFYSFINDEEPQWWKGSSRHFNNQKFYGRWHQQHEEETKSANLDPALKSDRLALGLTSAGPLSLGEVKSAYRACALKWHPDRHSGSSKAAAEEKFKLCGAAYQSLCDKLALN